MNIEPIMRDMNVSVPTFGVVIAVLCVLDFVLVIWAIIDCSRRRFESEGMKVAWVLACAFLSLPGILAYFLVGRRQSVPR